MPGQRQATEATPEVAILPRHPAPLGPPALERAWGEAHVGFKRRGPASVVADLRQAGCAKLRLPRPAPGQRPDAVLINTAGGLTDGDRLKIRADWGPGTEAAVTSQAAERIYRSRQAPAEVTTEMTVGAEASALWLPQETILFDRARLRRCNTVEMDPSARLVACEALVFGRSAMGERVHSGSVIDAWRIRAGGRLVFADTLRLEGDIEAQLARTALGAGAGALASVIYCGPDAQARLDDLRALAKREADGAGRCASSCLGFVTVTRILAPDGAGARRLLVRVLETLLDNLKTTQTKPGGQAGLPRVWAC